jgi:small GTP-binding protein
MGSSFKKYAPYFSKEDEARILMLGLDEVGKTTILYKLKLGEVVTTIPTIGFNVETITVANVNITTWDVGGRCKIRPLWRHYYANTSAIVFVVDSNDRERISEACHELHELMNEEELRNLPILIFANKQDLPNALTSNEIKEKLNLSKLDQMQTKWHVQPSAATKSEGLEEGFRWLANTIQSKTDYTQPIMETINDSKIMKNDLLYNFKTLLSKFI